MKKLLVLLLLPLSAFADGWCVFTWEPSLEREDETTFTVADIQNFKLYQDGVVIATVDDGTVTGHALQCVGRGMTDFYVTETVDDLESAPSVEVMVNLSAPPKKPISLTGNKQ